MCAHCTKKDTLDRSPTIFLEKQIRPPTLMLMVHVSSQGQELNIMGGKDLGYELQLSKFDTSITTTYYVAGSPG